MLKIQVLGAGCKKCNLLSANAEAAAQELGVVYEIEKVTDINEITDMGVQAVEKPQKSPTFGKIEHQNQGDADG